MEWGWMMYLVMGVLVAIGTVIEAFKKRNNVDYARNGNVFYSSMIMVGVFVVLIWPLPVLIKLVKWIRKK